MPLTETAAELVPGGCNFERGYLCGELSLRDLLVAVSPDSDGKESVSCSPCAVPCARGCAAHPKGTVAGRCVSPQSASSRLMKRSESGIWGLFQDVNGWG